MPCQTTNSPKTLDELLFVPTRESKVVKNRMHLDRRAADPARELQRLQGLGTTVAERLEHWIQLADPEGNEFCLMTVTGS